MVKVGDILQTPIEGMKRIDVQDGKYIFCTGNWSSESSELYNGGTGNFTARKGDTAEILVRSHRVFFIGLSNYNRTTDDHIQVEIDGVVDGTFSTYASTANPRQLQYIIEFDDDREHRIVFKNIAPDGKYMIMDAIDIDEDGELLPVKGAPLSEPAKGMIRYSSMDVNIKYDGTFNGNPIKYTDTIGDKVSFYFYGTRCYLLDNKYYDRADKIEIMVDGNLSKIINPYGADTHNVLVFDTGNLPVGIHKIEMINGTSTQRTRMGLENIDVKGFICLQDGKQNNKYICVNPIMKSNTSPAPYEVNQSSIWANDHKYDACIVFNGTHVNKYDAWASYKNETTGFITINLKRKLRISAIALRSRMYADETSLKATPADFALYGSNDNGETYELIKEWEHVVDWKFEELRIFELGKIVNYSMYKLDISKPEDNQVVITLGNMFLLFDSEFENYILKDGENYKAIDYDNNTLIDASLDDLNGYIFEGKVIFNLSDIIPYLSQLSDKFSIISKHYDRLNINAYKSYREMIIFEGNYILSVAKNINYIKPIMASNYDGTIKFIISTDNGVTWNTYNKETNEFVSISQEIPIKTYEDLTEEEKLVWNAAEEFIFNNGNDIEDLELIDFNEVESKYFKLAFVINSESESLETFFKSIIWQYNGKDYYKQLTNGIDVNILQNEDMVTIEALRDIKHLQVIINNGEVSKNDNFISSYEELRDIPKMDGIPFIGNMSSYKLNIATRTQLENTIKELQDKIKNDYVPKEMFNNLLSRVEALEKK